MLPPVDVLVREYESGASLRKIAAKYRSCRWTIKSRLVGAGVTVRRTGRIVAGLPPIDALVRDYESGLGLNAMRRKHGVPSGRIRDALMSAGCSIRPPIAAAIVSDGQERRMIQLYEDGETHKGIAAAVGVTRNIVHKILTRIGLTARSSRTAVQIIPHIDYAVIYVLAEAADPSNGIRKIGYCGPNRLRGRVKALLTGASRPLCLLYITAGSPELERRLKGRFWHLCSHGEWYQDDGSIDAHFIEHIKADPIHGRDFTGRPAQAPVASRNPAKKPHLKLVPRAEAAA